MTLPQGDGVTEEDGGTADGGVSAGDPSDAAMDTDTDPGMDTDTDTDPAAGAGEAQTPHPSGYRTRHFIFRTRRAGTRMAAVSRLHGWRYLGERPAGAGKPRILMFEVMPGLTVWYFENPDADVCGAAVNSTRCAAETSTPARLVQGLLVPWTLPELLTEIERAADTPSRCQALRRAGMGAPRPVDETFRTALTNAAADPDPEVRTAAILAMTYTEWPPFAPFLRSLADDDPKRQVRRFAKRAAELLEQIDPSVRPQPAPSDDILPADSAPELYKVAEHELDKVIAQYTGAR